MNLTLREVISQIKTTNKFINADSRITNKFIYSLLKKHRDYLVKQLDGRYQLMKLRYLFQTLDCVELIPTPTIHECCGVKSPWTIYRTKEKLPDLVNASIGPVFGRVTNIDGTEEISEITPGEWNRKVIDTNFKYNNYKYYFYNEGYLYFPNLEWKKVLIEGYFDDDVDHHNCLCGERKEHCVSMLDKQFRIPRHILAVCIENVNKELFSYYQRIPLEDEDINKNVNRKN